MADIIIYDENGKGYVTGHKIDRCCECNKQAEVLMKIGKKRSNDWIIADCDLCGDYLCKDCKIVDDDGATYCPICYQQIAMERANKKKGE